MIRAATISLVLLMAAPPDVGAATTGCDEGKLGIRPATAAPAPVRQAPSIQIPKIATPQVQPTIRLPQPTGRKTAVTQPAPVSGGATAEDRECTERRIPESLRQKDRQQQPDRPVDK